MTDDTELSRQLTAAIRATEGVSGVYPAQPILEAAAGAVAVRLALRVPDVLVDIDRADDFTTVSAHISTAGERPATETLRRVGELLLERLGAEPSIRGEVAVNVKVRLVEEAGASAVSGLA
ncbi:hypothetical protein EDF46_2565 [Frondihabitans sp. PhB188]|uniref:hypothetical protein n=1 Tax=Frondihabitans sp. PhB188 TaxID=2485200 RepID=UPI000F46348C|nr:hypothetical protein [Frondihabitans sp. PhB188]ROQ37116.1 hypothetical protein EDF46_2565 [Frondihabitans sp. PhB188]